MKIFEIVEGRIAINENCLLIPELRIVTETYEDPIPALSFCYFMTHPESPYSNLPDGERESTISEDVGGDFSFEDEAIENAITKLRKLYETPVQQLYEGGKNSMQVIGKYLKNLTESSISYGRDGNLGDIFRMQKELGKVTESFLKLEKLWTEQTKQKLRGSAELGEY